MAENNVRFLPFIGKKIRIVDAKTQTYKGLEGKIIDETKFSLMVENKGSIKRVLKKGTLFQIEGTAITGESIIGRCDQRIKK